MRQLLSDAIEDYMALRGSQDFSKRTLANENGILRRFLSITGNIWCHNIGEQHVTRYFEDASKTRAARSLQLDHTTLGQVFDWMRGTKRIPAASDPMRGRRRPVARQRERNRLHVSQFPQLLDAAEAQDPRDRMIVAVLLYTLVRDQEAADLRKGDVDLEGGWLRVRITKSHTEDRMPICAELDSELRRWLSIYSAETQHPLESSSYLIPRKQSVGLVRSGERGRIEGHSMVYVPGKPVARPGRVVRGILEGMGFPIEDDLTGKSSMEGSHTIRRSGARALFDRLVNDGHDYALRVVQSMLHHKSVTQTEQYIGITADRRSRDEVLRGAVMFPVSDENVSRLIV